MTLTNNTFFDNRCGGGNAGTGGNGGYCNPPSGGNSPGAAGGNGGAGGKGQGGGLFVDGSQCVSLNNTIASNRGLGGLGGSGGVGGAGCVPYGSGVSGLAGTPGSAPGVNAAVYQGGSLRLINTIVANGSPGTNCIGPITDGGHNLCSDASCAFGSALGSQNDTNPKLGPWGDYGGPTPTLRLLAASPALDAGDDALCPPQDQRGMARPFGWHCDIGAFEAIPDFFRITSSERGPGTVRLRGLGLPNTSYSIQATADFHDWTIPTTGTVTPDGRFDTQFSVQTPGAKQFFRTKSP